MCPFWHTGALDVPGVLGRWAPVKRKWLRSVLWHLAKDFDLFMFQVGQGKLVSTCRSLGRSSGLSGGKFRSVGKVYSGLLAAWYFT